MCFKTNNQSVWTCFRLCTSFPVDMTATTGNLCTLTSVTPTVASRPISDGPMCVPLDNTHSPRLMSCPIGLGTHTQRRLELDFRLSSRCICQHAVFYLMSWPGRACTMILTSSSSVPCNHPPQSTPPQTVARCRTKSTSSVVYSRPRTPGAAPCPPLGPPRRLHREWERRSSPSSPDPASPCGWAATHTHTHRVCPAAVSSAHSYALHLHFSTCTVKSCT